jgi:hypothetical protein
LANYPGCHGKCKDVERSWPMAMVHGSIGASPQKRRPTHVPKLSPLITPDKCPRTTPPTNHAHTHCTPPDAGRIPAQTVHPSSPLCASQTPAPRRAPTTMSNRYVHPPRQQLPLYTRRLHAPRFSRPGAQNDLFSSYNRSASPSKDKKKPRSPYAASPYSGAREPLLRRIPRRKCRERQRQRDLPQRDAQLERAVQRCDAGRAGEPER